MSNIKSFWKNFINNNLIYKFISNYFLFGYVYLINTTLIKNLKFFIEKNKNLFDSKYSSVLNSKGLVINIESHKIIKQNKSLTPLEFVSIIISNKNNKSNFYSPLHSFLPFFLSGSVFIFLVLMVAIFFREEKIANKNWFFYICVVGLSICIAFWFSMFWIEKQSGKHVDIIKHNILFGFYLFILTEGLCFLALFWTFLHSTLAASIHVGVFNPGEGVVNMYISESINFYQNWNIYCYHTWGSGAFYNLCAFYSILDVPLYNVNFKKVHINLFDSGSMINPWGLPLINTFILLSSAASLNASHCFMLKSKYFSSLVWLLVTILFGLLFVFMQFKEYDTCALNYNDGIFASCFFGITGLHGIHVMLGIFALSVCLFNILIKNYSPNFHQSFYFSIFYWHFVDIIWILVWLIIYLWPGAYFFKDFNLSCCGLDFFVFNVNTNFFLENIDLNAWYVFTFVDSCIYDQEVYYFKQYCFDLKVILFLYFEEYIWLNNFILDYNYIYCNESDPIFYMIDVESHYVIFLENIKCFNFNFIKKNVNFFCAFLNEIHNQIYNSVHNPIFSDIKYKYIRFIISTWLNIISKDLLYFYLYFLWSSWYLIKY